MHPVIGQCPVCQDQLIVARLYCPSCATAVEGRFTLGRLAQLNQEQLDFVETFIRCEGKLNRVQDELGISILADLAAGRISSADAMRMLQGEDLQAE